MDRAVRFWPRWRTGTAVPSATAVNTARGSQWTRLKKWSANSSPATAIGHRTDSPSKACPSSWYAIGGPGCGTTGEDPPDKSLLHELEKRLGAGARAALDANPWLAYGSTLLASAVTDSLALYLQLGDGDIVTVSTNGGVSRPWDRDHRLLGNETTSLAGPAAVEEMHVRVVLGTDSLPELILLSSDGYANSFREDHGFLAVGGDLMRMIRAEGVGPIQENLESWLQEASDLGSGDDVTLGILWRDLPFER